MAKPYPTVVENVIAAIIEKGPITVDGIRDELNFQGTTASLSGTVSLVWKKLGGSILERSRAPGKSAQFVYKRIDDLISTDEAIKMWRNGKTKAIPAPEHQQAEQPPAQAQAQGLLPTTINVNVVVSGRIDVVFRIGK